MNSKHIVFLILFILPFCGFSQVTDLPSQPYCVYFKNGTYESGDTTSRMKFHGLSNNVLLDYSKLNDSTLLRYEYSMGGSLVSMAQIKQVFGEDLIVVRNLMFDPMSVQTVKTLIDLPHGKYTAYFPGTLEEQQIMETGNCMNGIRVGQWEFYDRDGNKTLITYNEEGYPEGPYAEMYFHKKENKYTIKRRGAFKVREFKNSNPPGVSNKSQPLHHNKESRRSGTWEYYSKDGKLLEVAEYTWKN
jgi:antitoxin component YwqK of YwqJK toxin-antitoxin module